MYRIRVALAVATLAVTAAVPSAVAGAAEPPGPGWRTVFSDEFTGTQLDSSQWTVYSNAEDDQCLGNPDHQQLEWHTESALSVRDGALTITARKDNPHAGYEWSSGLIATGQSCGHDPSRPFSVQPGDYVETRLQLPSDKGFWPSTWTWNGSGSNEQDTYEFYADNHHNLYLTNHQDGSECTYQSPTDLTGDWHTIGEQLGPEHTTWYVDGRQVCTGGAFSGGGALILDMFVYAKIPPEVTEASMRIDSVHVYRK